MYNLIKMELYRLMRSTSTYVILVLSAVFLLFAVSMTKVDLDYMKESGEQRETVTESGVVVSEDTMTMNVGIYFDTDYAWIDGDINVSDYFITLLRSGSLLLFSTFFTAMFVNGENKNGFIKNVAGRVRFKGNIFLSKLPAIFAFNALLFAVQYFLSAIILRLVIGGITFGMSALQAKIIFVQLLLHLAFSEFVAMLAAVSKSTALSSTIGAIFCGGVGSLLWTAINTLVVYNDWIKDFYINKYTIVYNIQKFGVGLNTSDMSRVVTVALSFIAASCVIAVLTMNRRDVR